MGGLLYETVIGNWNELMKDWMFVFGKVPRDRRKRKGKAVNIIKSTYSVSFIIAVYSYDLDIIL